MLRFAAKNLLRKINKNKKKLHTERETKTTIMARQCVTVVAISPPPPKLQLELFSLSLNKLRVRFFQRDIFVFLRDHFPRWFSGFFSSTSHHFFGHYINVTL